MEYPPSRGSRTGSRGSPEGSLTTPVGLQGSRGSLQGSRASLNADIDPSLINPADTVPQGGPQDVPRTPDEFTTFAGFDDSPPKSTSKKKEGKGGVADKFRGSFGRVKGLCSKGSKTKGPAVPEIEDYDDDGLGSQEYLDRLETPPTDPEAKARQTAIQKFQNFFKKEPQMASPSVYQPGDIMRLKEKPPKSKFTMGNFINLLLILSIFAGFLMCTCIPVEPALYYLGPAFLGLGCFALIGKIYFTNFFWVEDPLPNALKPALAQYEKYLGGVKDPYGHKKYGKPIQKPIMTYYGPMSTNQGLDVVQMETFQDASFAEAPPLPKMYDESIDTRLRYTS